MVYILESYKCHLIPIILTQWDYRKYNNINLEKNSNMNIAITKIGIPMASRFSVNTSNGDLN